MNNNENLLKDLEHFSNMMSSLTSEAVFKTSIFTGKAAEDYKKKLNLFKKTNSSSYSSNKEKKETLEQLVKFISIKTNYFKVFENVKTTSNEIDLLLELTQPVGHQIFKNFLSDNFDAILCECKNYNKKIDVTWIGKFYSLLKTSKVRLGIIFSYNGFTGKNWDNGTGLTKKLYLVDSTLILDFSLPDFEELANEISFLEIIDKKIRNLKFDTNIQSYISSHPCE